MRLRRKIRSQVLKFSTQISNWWDPLGCVLWILDTAIDRTVSRYNLGNSSRVLDYGCGNKHHRPLFARDCEYIGADLSSNPLADVTLHTDGRVPLQDESFDLVLSTQVLEHVTDPTMYLRECERLLKPGGKLLLSTHGIMFYHPYPTDLWRWTSEGIEEIVTTAGLRLHSIEGVLGLAPSGIWLIMHEYHHALPRGIRQLFGLLGNLAILLLDRLTGNESKLQNSCVYVIVALKSSHLSEKPDHPSRSRTLPIRLFAQRLNHAG